MTSHLAVLAAAAADGRAARRARAVEERRVHLPLHRQRRQEVLRLDDPERVPRPAARADQQAGPGGQAHRPRGRREGQARQGSRGREEARAGSGQPRTRSAATARCSPPTPARRTSRTRARATCATTSRACRKCEKRIEDIKKRQAQFEKELDLFKTAGKGEPPTRLKEEITNAEIDLKAQQTLLDAKKKEAVGINARYDEDKRRYKEARRKQRQAARASGPASSAGSR